MSQDTTPPIGWKLDLLPNDSSKSLCREKPRKRKDSSSSSRSSSSSSSSSSSGSSSSSSEDSSAKRKKLEKRKARADAKKLKKEKKKQVRRERKEYKKAKKEQKKVDKQQRKLEKQQQKLAKKAKKHIAAETAVDCGPPIHLMNNKACAPQTKEEYDAKQSIIRRVKDPESGRIRLIKGDGEILEEIVTRDKHKEINRQATKGDGQYFQSHTVGWEFD